MLKECTTPSAQHAHTSTPEHQHTHLRGLGNRINQTLQARGRSSGGKAGGNIGTQQAGAHSTVFAMDFPMTTTTCITLQPVVPNPDAPSASVISQCHCYRYMRTTRARSLCGSGSRSVGLRSMYVLCEHGTGTMHHVVLLLRTISSCIITHPHPASI